MELESAFEGRTSSKFTPLSPLASPRITACCIFDRAAPSCDQSLPAAFVYTLPPPSRCWSRIPAGEPAASLGIALDPPSALPSPGQPCQCPALAQPPAQPHCPAPLPCPLPSPWCRAGPPASRNRSPHARPAAAAAPVQKGWAGMSGAEQCRGASALPQPCPACSVQQVLQHSQAAAQSQPTPPCNPATSPLADGPEAQAGAGCRGPGSQLPQPQAGVPGPLLVLWR